MLGEQLVTLVLVQREESLLMDSGRGSAEHAASARHGGALAEKPAERFVHE